MYIVIDTNIWISELGLSTPRGKAFQFFAKQRGAVIAIPEVVKREVEVNIKEMLESHTDTIDKSYNQLLPIFGAMKEIVLLNENDINNCVASLFEKLSAEAKHIPFTLESARQSLEKVINGIPPSGPKNQQFKDGVIWADCVTLLAEDDVALLTKDKGFYQDREYQNGLANNLQAEIDSSENTFQIFPSLTGILQEIEEPIDIDKEDFVNQFAGEIETFTTSLLNRNGFEISGQPEVSLSSYVTEDVNKLYIEFEITYSCIDITEDGRSGATLTVLGDAMYEPGSKRISEMRRKGESLDFIDTEGIQQRKKIVVMVGPAVSGQSTIESVVRHELDKNDD